MTIEQIALLILLIGFVADRVVKRIVQYFVDRNAVDNEACELREDQREWTKGWNAHCQWMQEHEASEQREAISRQQRRHEIEMEAERGRHEMELAQKKHSHIERLWKPGED